MATSTTTQPEMQGADSTENVPQVVVRAGKYYMCSACGTLVEIPADVIDQFEIPVQPVSKEPQPSEPQTSDPPQYQSTQNQPPLQTSPAAAKCDKPASTQFSQSPKAPPLSKGQPLRRRVRLAGKIIDGLRVPSASQLDRAFSWVTYQLKVVDQKNSEIKRLKKLLKANAKFASSCPRPRDHENSNEQNTSAGSECRAKPTHAHALVSMAPQRSKGPTNPAKERGPP